MDGMKKLTKELKGLIKLSEKSQNRMIADVILGCIFMGRALRNARMAGLSTGTANTVTMVKDVLEKS